MLWNGGMLGLGFANFDGSLAVPAVAGLVVASLVAWALKESTGVWDAFLKD